MLAKPDNRDKAISDILGQNTTLRDHNVAKEFVEFLVVSDGQLQVPGNDTRFLVIASG